MEKKRKTEERAEEEQEKPITRDEETEDEGEEMDMFNIAQERGYWNQSDA